MPPTDHTQPTGAANARLQPLQSALYVGLIRHRRYFPHAHGFSYPIYMSWMDLDELDRVFAGRWFWSTKRFALAQFRRRDFYGDANIDLATAVRDRVFTDCGSRPLGPIRLLTHLRHFGLSFNPVSFYFCYQEDGQTLHSILAEITNTPWRERFTYTLRAGGDAAQRVLQFEFEKRFHVSPFLPMGLHYSWRFAPPEAGSGCDLRVHMNVHAVASTATAKVDDSTRQFDATLILKRQPITGVHLAGALLRFPFITLSVVWKIYWHALRLKWKRNPFFDHPELAPAAPAAHTAINRTNP